MISPDPVGTPGTGCAGSASLTAMSVIASSATSSSISDGNVTVSAEYEMAYVWDGVGTYTGSFVVNGSATLTGSATRSGPTNADASSGIARTQSNIPAPVGFSASYNTVNYTDKQYNQPLTGGYTAVASTGNANLAVIRVSLSVNALQRRYTYGSGGASAQSSTALTLTL